MARATVRVAATTMAPMTLGTSSRNMMVASDAPIIRAAVAKSRSRRERTWFWTTRATSIQAVAAMITVIIGTLGLMKAASARSRNTEGKHKMASTMRISTAPIQRP